MCLRISCIYFWIFSGFFSMISYIHIAINSLPTYNGFLSFIAVYEAKTAFSFFSYYEMFWPFLDIHL